ncbi:NADP-dependent oxidoreductase [Neobacillus sp. GCM10023253]|uniref:NADP-dependent oxidoreductase n=1 Tax=Neobacillus sp. GCM10023253 TaxID=3252644 RepID=UPI003617297E
MSTQLMNAIRVHHYGGPEVLKLERIPLPRPEAGEVLIRVHAAGVLPYDWKYRQGLFKDSRPASFPYIPGSSFSGTVEKVGPDVHEFCKGQEVFGRSQYGTYAEFTVAPAAGLMLKPSALSFDESVTIPGSAVTAWLTLFRDGELKKGEKVLIHGAAGGFGMIAVQLAKWKGAFVIGTCSAKNVDFLYSLGVDTVIDYTSKSFDKIVQDVDLVVDTIGGETLDRSWTVVKMGGKLLSMVEQPSVEKVQRFGLKPVKPYSLPHLEEIETISKIISQMIVGKQVKVCIFKKFPLEKVQEAHKLSQRGHGRGRIILNV